MASPKILIVGNCFSTLRKYLTEHGYDHLLLKDIRLTDFPDKQFKNRAVCDFSKFENVLRTVDELVREHTFNGVMVTYENYIVTAARIAERLMLPGMPVESAKACTDKFLMRQMFGDAPEKISPDFAVVESEQAVRDFAAAHRFPLILKPANLSKSLLVTKSGDLDELLASYRRTAGNIQAVYAKYAPGSKPKILIEEFMEGPVHSVDAFIDSSGEPHVLDAVVDYQTGYEIGYDDNFHYSRILPSKLPAREIAAICRTAAQGCKALGMKNSPAHIEIIRTADGPRIVEIGARNGGYRERMHLLANGIDITGNAINLALDRPLNLQADRNESVAVLELFPKTPGTFKGIANEKKLKQLTSLNYFAVKADPGSFIGKSSDGYKMAACIILHNADPEQFAKDLDFVNKQVYVETEPVN
ncbi:MAG TPA: ATP-grasp domain-containing protein [Candidatus Pristimantibacillus sp.]|jgi:biotin carboxylase|nr:ATP-grasp domain-containing protein [Candidatus Pristimantibacillus sp.]